MTTGAAVGADGVDRAGRGPRNEAARGGEKWIREEKVI